MGDVTEGGEILANQDALSYHDGQSRERFVEFSTNHVADVCHPPVVSQHLRKPPPRN